jgi:hypothetical protein
LLWIEVVDVRRVPDEVFLRVDGVKRQEERERGKSREEEHLLTAGRTVFVDEEDVVYTEDGLHVLRREKRLSAKGGGEGTKRGENAPRPGWRSLLNTR